MNQTEIQAIVAKQRAFFASGATLDIEMRREVLKRFRSTLIKYENEMIEAAKSDMGRADVETYFMEIHMNLEELDFTLKHLDKWTSREAVKTPTLFFLASSKIHPEPYGTTLIISAWNYPFMQLFGPLIGAIAAGNTAILKPASDSAHSAKVARRIIEEVFPPEYVIVIEGTSDITTRLLEEKLDYVFFTGSPRVGRIIQAAASKHLTPVTLELGGKSPAIVEQDADIDLAAKRIVWCKSFNAGQICVTVDHCYVHSSVKEAFIEHAKKWIAAFYGDDPSQSPDYGFLINQKNFDRALSYLKDGRIRHGGRHDRERRYLEPTLMDEVLETAPVMQEEIFAPILPILTFDSLEELLERQRAKEKPLALYFFSSDEAKQELVVRRTSSGGITINDCMSHGGTTALPFGGVGQSGMGAYHGKHTFDTFSHFKAVMYSPTARVLDVALKYPPYAGKLASVKRLEKIGLL
jgi:acyl-CoA reductase-like NAD-dependent aldehyde dehydrogenase